MTQLIPHTVSQDRIIFRLNAEEVTLSLPEFPFDPGRVRRQAVVPTIGGRIVSVTYGSEPVVSPVLRWPAMPTDEYDALRAFIEDHAEGSVHTFTWIDWDDDESDAADAHTVRYVRGLPGQWVDQNQWRVELQLLLEG